MFPILPRGGTVHISLTNPSLSKTSLPIIAEAKLILFFDSDPDVAGNPPCCKCSSNYVGLYPLCELELLTRSFFSVPRKNDPDPGLLFKGIHIASRKDICTEHMGSDFKVRVFSLQTVQTTRLRVAGSHRQFLGGNDKMFWKFKDLVSVFRPLQDMERLSHAVS